MVQLRVSRDLHCPTQHEAEGSWCSFEENRLGVSEVNWWKGVSGAFIFLSSCIGLSCSGFWSYLKNQTSGGTNTNGDRQATESPDLWERTQKLCVKPLTLSRFKAVNCAFMRAQERCSSEHTRGADKQPRTQFRTPGRH